MTKKNPRARIKGETEKAYNAFIKYLDYGDKRSIEKMPERGLKTTVNQLKKWSKRYHWIERVKTVTDHDEEIKQNAHEKALEEMTIRHTMLAQAMQIRAGEKLKTLDPNELNPRDVSTLIKSGVDIERQARGVSDKIEMDIKGNLTHSINIQLIETSVEEIKRDKAKNKPETERDS